MVLLAVLRARVFVSKSGNNVKLIFIQKYVCIKINIAFICYHFEN